MKVYINALNEGLDRKVAEQFYNGFSSIPNVFPWLPSENILPGQDKKKTMAKEIFNSDYFLAIISRQSLKSGIHLWEQRQAMEKMEEMTPYEIFAIPVWCDDMDFFEDVRRQFPVYELKPVFLFPDWNKALRQIFKSMRLNVPKNMNLQITD